MSEPSSMSSPVGSRSISPLDLLRIILRALVEDGALMYGLNAVNEAAPAVVFSKLPPSLLRAYMSASAASGLFRYVGVNEYPLNVTPAFSLSLTPIEVPSTEAKVIYCLPGLAMVIGKLTRLSGVHVPLRSNSKKVFPGKPTIYGLPAS